MANDLLPGYFRVENCYIDVYLPIVGEQAFSVLLYLLRRADKQGLCWPSQATIADDTGIPFRSVQVCCTKLKRAGLVRIFKRDFGGRRHSNCYEILRPPVYDTIGTNSGRSSTSAETSAQCARSSELGAGERTDSAQGLRIPGAALAPGRATQEGQPRKGEPEPPPSPRRIGFQTPEASLPALALAKQFVGLARRWPAGGADAYVAEIASQLDEIFRRGVSPADVTVLVDSPARDRLEMWSTFRDRLPTALKSIYKSRDRVAALTARAADTPPASSPEEMRAFARRLAGAIGAMPDPQTRTAGPGAGGSSGAEAP